MAYTETPSVSTGDLWTAANQNTYLRDNLIDHETRILAVEAGGAVPTLVTKRQGGSETAWATKGTTNYTPTAASIKRYKGVIEVYFNNEQLKSAVITFPDAFAYAPHVMCSGSVSTMIFSSATPTTSQVTIWAYNVGGQTTGACYVSWEAEGI
jgi:hypothetical protein